MNLLGQSVTLRTVKTSSGPFRVGTYTNGSIRMDPVYEVQREGEAAMARLTAHILTRQLAGDQQLLEVSHPATWWQHLKASMPSWLWPAWARKRWPVRICVTRAKASFAKYDAYPGADVPLPPELGIPVQYDMVSWTGPAQGWGDNCDGTCTPVVRSTPVSDGRQFISRDELVRELASLLYLEVRSVPTVVEDVFSTLERLGVNTGQLVQRYALEEAHRTW